MPETGTQQDFQAHEQSSDDGAIVVGVLSFNNSGTIGSVMHAAQEGLRAFSSQRPCLLVNADGGSKDGTQAIAEEAAGGGKSFLQIPYTIDPVQKLSPEYPGVPGK